MRAMHRLLAGMRAVRERAWPACSRCSRRTFVMCDRASELNTLRPLGLHRSEFDGYTSLCGSCWREISSVVCGCCGDSFSAFSDRKCALEENLAGYGVRDRAVQAARWVCPACEASKRCTCCERCRVPFLERQARQGKLNEDPEIARWLGPCHAEYRRGWGVICPACWRAIRAACADVQMRLREFAGGTAREQLSGHRTVQVLGRIAYKESGCREPAEVEQRLRLYAVQMGGNAFVRFFWQKNEDHKPESYLAGHSVNGNPYYRTRTTVSRWYTGSAEAVVVVTGARNRGRPRHGARFGRSG